MSQPGVLGGLMPTSPGDLMRRIVDLERALREVQGGRILDSAAAGGSGLAIVGGAFKMPLIDFGDVPGSMWWDDGYDHHGALFQSVAQQTVLASPWNVSDPNHPTLLLDAAGRIAQLYISQDDPAVDEPALLLKGGAGSQLIELLVILAAGSVSKYANILLHNGMVVQPTGAGHGQVFFGNNGDDTHTSVQGAAFFVNNHVRMQFGPGDQGLYYAEEWDLPAQTVTAGQQWQVGNGLTLTDHNNDYPATAMDTGTGVWTCPETGWYHFTFCAGFDTWASGSRLGLRILNQTANRVIANRDQNPSVTAFAKDTVTARRRVIQGDQVIFQLTNGSAGSRVVSATSPETSYISVQREL